MEFSSQRFCRTNSRHSSILSCGRAFVETRNKRSKALAAAELLAKLARRVFAGNPADAHPIKHAVGRIILLDEDWRIGDVEAVAKTFCGSALAESTDLHGEKTRGRTGTPNNLPSHQH